MPLDQRGPRLPAARTSSTRRGRRASASLLVAARRDMVERVARRLRGAGLRPEGIDLAAFAMVRALHRAGPRRTSTVLYLADRRPHEPRGRPGHGLPLHPRRRRRPRGPRRRARRAQRADPRARPRLARARRRSRRRSEQIEGDDAAIVEDARVRSSLDGVRRIAAEVRNSLDFHHAQDDAAERRARRHDRARPPRCPASPPRWPPSSACPSSRAPSTARPPASKPARVTDRRRPGRRGGAGMRAVNLIPADERRGARATSGIGRLHRPRSCSRSSSR